MRVGILLLSDNFHYFSTKTYVVGTHLNCLGSTKTYVVGTHLNCLTKTVQISTHNMFLLRDKENCPSMSTHNMFLLRDKEKLSFGYHQIPTLSKLLAYG